MHFIIWYSWYFLPPYLIVFVNLWNLCKQTFFFSLEFYADSGNFQREGSHESINNSIDNNNCSDDVLGNLETANEHSHESLRPRTERSEESVCERVESGDGSFESGGEVQEEQARETDDERIAR